MPNVGRGLTASAPGLLAVHYQEDDRTSGSPKSPIQTQGGATRLPQHRQWAEFLACLMLTPLSLPDRANPRPPVPARLSCVVTGGKDRVSGFTDP